MSIFYAYLEVILSLWPLLEPFRFFTVNEVERCRLWQNWHGGLWWPVSYVSRTILLLTCELIMWMRVPESYPRSAAARKMIISKKKDLIASVRYYIRCFSVRIFWNGILRLPVNHRNSHVFGFRFHLIPILLFHSACTGDPKLKRPICFFLGYHTRYIQAIGVKWKLWVSSFSSGFHQEVCEWQTKMWVHFGRPQSNSKICLKIAIVQKEIKKNLSADSLDSPLSDEVW